MTTKSINHPWGVSDKFRTRYGNTWADLDFVFEAKISAENFSDDPMNTTIGELHIAGQHILMRYKDLIAYAKLYNTLSDNLYAEKLSKDTTMEISIKGRNFMLNKQEIGKLSTTLDDATKTAIKGYQLGLYI
jgi:hypothetical protein